MMIKNNQWHYWNNKHNDRNYNYDNVSICRVLVEYIDSLNIVNNFLDHGCGYGRVSKMIFNKFPNAKITLNDIIDKPIQQNKTELSKCKSVSTVLGQIHHIADKFDCIISHRVIHSCPNYKDTFREIFRLMSENSSCFISVRSNECVQKDIDVDFLNKTSCEIIKPNGRFTKLFDKKEFTDLITNCGLTIKDSGQFYELSAKTTKANNYLYAICQN